MPVRTELLLLGVAVLLLSALFAAAQAPPQMPKPGPEQKNLAYFAGNWKITGDMKAGPMGPGGKFTGSEHIEWMPGGFFLVSHSQGSSAMGKESGMAVYGYDTEKKTYTYDEFNSRGEPVGGLRDASREVGSRPNAAKIATIRVAAIACGVQPSASSSARVASADASSPAAPHGRVATD